MATGTVVAVSRSATHSFSKPVQKRIRLMEGLGVEGDAHQGKTVQHRSIMARDPNRPNLRQVHLIPFEVQEELHAKGFPVTPGQMGENITTQGIDLLELPKGARLHIGESAVVELTGLRDPCGQLNGVQKGLMAAVLDKDEQGEIIRKAGVMSIVIAGGEVQPGDAISVELPAEPHEPLQVV